MTRSDSAGRADGVPEPSPWHGEPLVRASVAALARRDTWAGNRCDVCGKFRNPGELVEHEDRHLGVGGELVERWWLECDHCRGGS